MRRYCVRYASPRGHRVAVPTPYSEAVGGGALKARASASSSSLSVFLRGGAPKTQSGHSRATVGAPLCGGLGACAPGVWGRGSCAVPRETTRKARPRPGPFLLPICVPTCLPTYLPSSIYLSIYLSCKAARQHRPKRVSPRGSPRKY